MLRNGAPFAEHIVLNDVVITKGAISRLIDLAVHVDGRFVTDVKADGLILGSPTGSTAYNLAAGGPIVHPGVDALLITPIAPHALGNRPIVIPGRCTISVRHAADSGKDEMFATFDGQTGYAFGQGDEVRVTRADHAYCGSSDRRRAATTTRSARSCTGASGRNAERRTSDVRRVASAPACRVNARLGRPEGRSCQNTNFTASWITRGSPAVVIVPNAADAEHAVRRAERRRVGQVEHLGAELERLRRRQVAPDASTARSTLR